MKSTLSWRSVAKPIGLLCGVAWLAGCPATLPDGATALDAVAFVGNKRVSAGDLLEAIASDPTHKLFGISRVWWVDYGTYDRIELEKDLKRIERVYHTLGYYEARVLAGTVISTGKREVSVEIVVDEGAQVQVGPVDVQGIDELPKDLRATLVKTLRLKGGAFEEKPYRLLPTLAERALTDAGYAYAKVKVRATIDLIRHVATVHASIDAGVRCTFGTIAITGLAELHESAVRTVIDIAPDAIYSTEVTAAAQRALFDLGVFDAVEIVPELADSTANKINLVVKVAESKLRRLKLGLGFQLDPIRDDVHLLGSWEDRNFIGGLRTFRTDARPLVVLKPGLTRIDTIRPGFSTSVTLRQPSFIEARSVGSLTATTAILPDPVVDYRTFSTRASIGMERRFGKLLNLGIFYRKGFDFPTGYGDTELPANVYRSQIGYAELLAAVDLRDNVISPHRGFYASLSLQYAFASSFFLAGDFGDVRIQPEVRGYLPLGKRVTLAARALVGLLFARNYKPREPNRRAATADNPSEYESETGGETPLWRAFFSGGATSNRGYPTRYVGLRDCAEGEVGAGCSEAIGGATLWEASLELRWRVVGDFGIVFFLDASDVSRNPLDLRFGYPHLAAGPGLRYLTPFGPLRVDFGVRLPGLQRIGGELDPREQPGEFSFIVRGPFALHLSIGEAF